MSDFPPVSLASQEDSKYREDTMADPTQRNEMEGGYTITRPRYTRAPRKTFTTGFTDITEAQRADLEAFWNSKSGGALSFTWTDPITTTEYTVRFVGKPTYKYAGMRGTFRWNVTSISLEQV